MTSSARTARDADPDQAGPVDDAGPGTPGPGRFRAAVGRHRVDLAVCLLLGLIGVWLTNGLWPDPASRVLALNPEDQVLYEWFLAMDARVLHGDLSLLTDRLNVPDGVNMMANTTVIALGVLCAPVTLLFGVPVTFALLATAGLAGTAIAWYLFYRRVLVARPISAAVGGGFCGFAPGMISQTNSHLHMTVQWLVPVMLWLVVRMVRASDPQAQPAGRDRRRIITSAVWLAVTVSVQVFIGEEVLFLTALSMVLFAVAYGLIEFRLTRRVLPGFLGGMLLATGLAVLALAYPLWFQFSGPQSVPNGLFSPHYFYADLASWPAISPLSLAGTQESARLTTGPAEYNTFLGWPLLVVTVLALLWLGRRAVVAACGIAGLVMAALSLGPVVVINKTPTEIEGPYSALLGIPVVDGALPMRFALALIPLIATVLVLAMERAFADEDRVVRFTVPVVVAAVLLPIFPKPLPTSGRPPLPEFITAGHWRDCVQPDGVLVPVPLATPQQPWPMRWAAATDVSFGMPEGFFIGPYAAGGMASMGTYKQPTSHLLAEVSRTGVLPPLGEPERQQAQLDVNFWGASCVALVPDAPNHDQLKVALDALYGPGTRMADVWAWKVQPAN